MTSPTVALVTLGCARNEVDSDQLATLLTRASFRLVGDAGDADVVIVNTCTFIQPATEESIEAVLAACDLKDDRTRAVVVTGCMAERYGEELAAALPEVDAVVGFASYPRLPELVGELLAGRQVPPAPPARRPVLPVAGSARGYLPQDQLDRIPESGPRFPLRGFGAAPTRPWAYLKIASGCDRTCTFCAIPTWRGRFRSRPLDEIVAEARWLVARGAKELVLVSENTTSWGKDLPADGRHRGRDLQPMLLEALSAIEGLELIRLMYLQPAELRRPLLEAIAALPSVAAYFDLSLQHVAAPVLARMRRTGSSEAFRELIATIRALTPDAVLRSSFIVGFPGENDRDVAELADFLADARIDWAGFFAFSPQEATVAAGMDGQVPPEVAGDRLRALVDLQEGVADDAAARFVGRRLDVIVQEVADDTCVARSYREAPDTDGEVRVGSAHGVPVGSTVTVDIVASDGVDLVGVPARLTEASLS